MFGSDNSNQSRGNNSQNANNYNQNYAQIYKEQKVNQV